jgi:peptide/nickel transport system ATP-binding protein
MEKNNREVLIEVKKLKKFFPLKRNTFFDKNQLFVKAVEDVSLSIYKGEVLGLVGESGCGKSTFGRVILQLYPTTSGAVIYHHETHGNVSMNYIEDEIKKIPIYQKKAIESYQKSISIDKKIEKLKSEMDLIEKTSDIVDKSYNSKKKNLELIQHHSRELKKDSSRQLREASRTIGKLILHPNIQKVSALLLEANLHIKNKADILLGLNDQLPSEYPDQIREIFKELIKMRKDKPLEINERVVITTYVDKLEKNREVGINLTKLDNEELRKLRPNLQMIFQDPYSSLDSRMTVGQLIGEALVEHGRFKPGSKELETYVLETMKKCGLDAYMIHRYPHQFSGGQRQRIGIARTLALQPEFVVCDEAVSALDVSIRSQIINLLKELKNSNELTYLFISHDLSVIKHISDRIGVMYLGNLVELGGAEEVYRNPLHPYTKTLISAIPTTEKKNTERIILKGDIPSNIFPPSGCKFRTRCPLATEKCARSVPEYREVEPGRFVACHHYEQTKEMK